MEKLPLELLEKVWGYLNMFDFIRCQQVCAYWKACLPGDRSTLNEAMFSPLTRWTPIPADRPTIHIWIEPSQHIVLSENQLPHLSFSLDFDNSYGDWYPYDRARILHPILKYPADYSHLIHPAFTPGDKYSEFQFTTTF